MRKPETYFGQLSKALKTAFKGLRLTGKHYRRGYHREVPLGIEDPGYFKQAPGPITIQYPKVKVPVPDNGRYRLHMETDDCIGCDKCARICPVDCITIETFRADGDIGQTSDGTTKRLHLPVFDIDMGKCMFCGLCTTVCPTECLTMTKVYDFSEFDRDNLVYHFGAYSPAEEEKIRKETEISLEKKKAEKANALPSNQEGSPQARPRPIARPVAQPIPETENKEEQKEAETPVTPVVRPRPMMKRAPSPAPEEAPTPPTEETPAEIAPEPPKTFRPRPIMKRAEEPAENPIQESAPEEITPETPQTPKPFRPRPIMKRPPADNEPTTPPEP